MGSQIGVLDPYLGPFWSPFWSPSGWEGPGFDLALKGFLHIAVQDLLREGPSQGLILYPLFGALPEALLSPSGRLYGLIPD